MKKLLFSAEGRIGRWTYWKWSLILNGLLLAVTALLLLTVYPIIQNESDPMEIGLASEMFMRGSAILCLVTYIAGIWSLMVLAVKRLHDMNKSGFNLFWVIAWSILYLIYLGLNRGTQGPNAFGDDPIREEDRTPTS